MKRFLYILVALLMAAPALMAQTQPDAEYNLIRRSYKLNSDGSMDIRFRKEIKILRNRALTGYADKGETFIIYNPEFETLKINESYTLRADGTKVETPKNAFVEQLPFGCTDCGRYNGLRELVIVHTAMEYNCTIVLDYTLHRNSGNLSEMFNLNQDCPVKRYEIRYADGHTETHTNLPQTVKEPYLPAKNGYDVVFQLGEKPTFTAQTSLPDANDFLSKLFGQANATDDLAKVTAIRNWVVDDVHLNDIDPSHTNYAMTPAEQVFATNCGTAIDKAGLLAALLNQAGFEATIIDNSINAFGDKPMEVEATVNNVKYRLSATQKTPIQSMEERTQAYATLADPVYIDRELPWTPDTLVDGYLRFTLPIEQVGTKINLAQLTPTRVSDLYAGNINEFYHYVVNLPKGAKLLGGDVNIEYTLPNLGSINVIVKQKKGRLIVTRSLRLLKPVISANDYAGFRRLMTDWNSHRELYFAQ